MPPANESGRVPKAVRLPRLFMGRATGLTEQKRYPSHACRLLVTVTVLTVHIHLQIASTSIPSRVSI